MNKSLNAYLHALTHQIFIEYVLWAKMICVSLSCVLLPFNSEDSTQPSEVRALSAFYRVGSQGSAWRFLARGQMTTKWEIKDLRTQCFDSFVCLVSSQSLSSLYLLGIELHSQMSLVLFAVCLL